MTATASAGPAASSSRAPNPTPPDSPPDWRTTPIIFPEHVATEAATSGRLPHTGLEMDLDRTALTTMEARYAVRYGLPLTTMNTIARLTKGKGPSASKVALDDFVEEWGDVNPFFFVLSVIPRDQSFWRPGESLPPPPIPQEEVLLNKRMAEIMITSVISIKATELGSACPEISPSTIHTTLNLYDNQGKFDTFSIGNAANIWEILAELQHQQDALTHDDA
ncbi:hypothetical protein EDB84DRAFT_1564370 [Lactarius hengduanensis]|nr:hypothetical protein EDB84DRAFT_1564370 [Lactarius hengduanensis]